LAVLDGVSEKRRAHRTPHKSPATVLHKNGTCTQNATPTKQRHKEEVCVCVCVCVCVKLLCLEDSVRRQGHVSAAEDDRRFREAPRALLPSPAPLVVQPGPRHADS
jgi:hypothetical protein